jgi:hypothetical protein
MRWGVSPIKKVVVLLTMIIAIAASTLHAQGTGFPDVSTNHWAFPQIKRVVEAGILTLRSDGRFDPDGDVSRAEFAMIMVKALAIETSTSEAATFLDVKDHWARPYVEAAKFYLTGWKTANGYTFKPELASVREDMAVALVKAKGMDSHKYSLKTLDAFADKGAISASLVKYVCIAVEQGIMVGGAGADGKTYFRPQSNLSRAETASLISRVANLTQDEEKVSFGDEKVTIPGSYLEAATLQGKVVDNSVVLKRSPVTKPGLAYYKVVMAKYNKTPAYPDSGSIACITQTDYTIKPGSKYSGGDFGGTVKAGETYYFSVTAVYDDGKTVPGNVITLKMPGTSTGSSTTEGKNAVLEAKVVNGGILLNWTGVSQDNFQYYKVVLSTQKSNPSYPNDGYIICTNDTSYLLKPHVGYNGGDFGGKTKSGQTYYVSVTSVYKDAKNTSNVVKVTLP